MNIFEIATRKKFRFPSARGELTVEQLWDLPLVAGSRVTRDVKCDLDTIARGINSELKSVTEESFVVVKPDPRKGELTTKLEVVKHIIDTKVAEAEAAKKVAANAEKRSKLLDALANQEDQELRNMSKDDILKQLAEIDGE